MKQLQSGVLTLLMFVIDTMFLGTLIFCAMSIVWWIEGTSITLFHWIGCLVGYHLIDTTRAKFTEISIEVNEFFNNRD